MHVLHSFPTATWWQRAPPQSHRCRKEFPQHFATGGLWANLLLRLAALVVTGTDLRFGNLIIIHLVQEPTKTNFCMLHHEPKSFASPQIRKLLKVDTGFNEGRTRLRGGIPQQNGWVPELGESEEEPLTTEGILFFVCLHAT